MRQKWIFVVLFLVLSHAVFAASGNFFIVNGSEVEATIEVSLCLNGKGPLTCQLYQVQNQVLTVFTTTPGHTYPAAGIKVITPGFAVSPDDSNCTLISNGYCLFSVSNLAPATIIINPYTQPELGIATISVFGSPLGLNVNGSSGFLLITNTSSKDAFNISSNFTGTALEGNVQETGNTCQVLKPGKVCRITFTPGSTVVPETIFLIQGDNTLPVSAKIVIEPPGVADISVLNPHLSLQTNASGSMTVVNNSSSITATNITSNFTGTALDGKVTETGNTCASVLPGASCTLTFTAGATPVAETVFPIQGNNTTSVNADISISTPAMAELQVSNSPLLLNTNGVSGQLTITNISNAVTAINITSNFTGTALDGNVTETGNTCATVLPGNSCTLTYTPGGTAVPQTTFTIAGTNTDTINAAIQITSLTIGSNFGGGKVACLTSTGGFSNLIAAVPSIFRAIWQRAPLSKTGATSDTNGAQNTSTIVAAIGSNPITAAGRCASYEVDSAGNTPCQTGNTCYNDWFLPAIDELDCLFENKNAIGGFRNSEYWTSTEQNKNNAFIIDFANGNSRNRNKNSYFLNIRCVRAFTP